MAIQIRQHDWAEFIRQNPFTQVLLSAISVLIGYVHLQRVDDSPLVLHPALTIAGFLFAFLRTWLAIKEEAETSEAWEIVDRYSTGWQRFANVALETPWVLIIVILPFTSISVQILLIAAGIFYVIDFWWNHMFAAALREYYYEQCYGKGQREHCPVMAYFVLRNKLSATCGSIALFGTAIIWPLVAHGREEAVLPIGLAILVALILIEGVIGIWLSLDFRYLGRMVDDLDIGYIERVFSEVETLYEDSFDAEERYESVESMRGKGCKVLVARRLGKTSRAGSHDNGEVVGFAVYEFSEPFAFLWYLAVKVQYQNLGVGSAIVKRVLEDIATDKCAVRYAMFEVGHHMENYDKLVSFYRRLGAYRLRGLEYVRPASFKYGAPREGRETLRYDVMFFRVAGEIDQTLLKQGVQAMVADATWKANDQRLERLIASLDDMFIQPPDAPASDNDD